MAHGFWDCRSPSHGAASGRTVLDVNLSKPNQRLHCGFPLAQPSTADETHTWGVSCCAAGLPLAQSAPCPTPRLTAAFDGHSLAIDGSDGSDALRPAVKAPRLRALFNYNSVSG